MLLWSDKIILTNHCNDYIQNTQDFDAGKKMGTAVRNIFDIAKEYNMVEIKDPDAILTSNIVEKIEEEIKNDRIRLARRFPREIRLGGPGVPGEIFVNNEQFCGVRLRGVYESLFLAKEWKAESLFSDEIYDYCNHKFALSLRQSGAIKTRQERIKAFNHIFSVALPEQDLIPNYALDDLLTNEKLRCSTCNKMEICDKNFVSDLENNVRTYLELREYDEIQQIRGVLQDISNKLENGNPEVDYTEIMREFQKQERDFKRDLYSTFPKMKQWTLLGMWATIPFTLFTAASLGLNPVNPITYTGASAAAACTAAEIGVKFFEAKYKWVGFIQKAQRKSH